MLCLLSAILGFQISSGPPCLFLQSVMGNCDVNAPLDVFKTQRRLNLETKVPLIVYISAFQPRSSLQ